MPQIFTKQSLAYKKFCRRYENRFDLTLRTEGPFGFVDEVTAIAWQFFIDGWSSHPSFPDKVSIIAKLRDDGTLQFAERPSVHRTSMLRREQERLTAKYGGTFVVFSTTDPDFTAIALKQIEARRAIRKAAEAEVKALTEEKNG